MNRITLSLAALASLGSLAIAGCNADAANPSAAAATSDTAAVPVQVDYPRRADLLATYGATTTLATDGDAPVPARVAGDVIDIHVEEGDRVVAGQVLATLDGERLRLEMLAAKAEVDRARAEYERYVDLHERGLVSKAMFDGLRFDLDALQATFERRQLEYGYAQIRAPIAGVVSARMIRPGQHLQAGTPAFRVTDTHELRADLQLPQTELSRIRAGQRAWLRVDSIPDTRFPAEIVRTSPTVDAETGTFRATAVVNNAAGRLAPGMFARFSIAYDTHENALVIPARALVDEDDGTAVYVVDGDAVKRRRIVTGIRSGDDVEVLDGLGAEDRIVVIGQDGLRDGSRVVARLADPARSAG